MSEDLVQREAENHLIHCVSPQVLPPFLGAEWSVLQCDGLLRPGEYAQVSVKAAHLFFFVLTLGIKRKPAKTGKYHSLLHKHDFDFAFQGHQP